MNLYTLTTAQALEHLASSTSGLSKKEAAFRLQKNGRNSLLLAKEPFLRILIEPFKSVFVVVLLLASIVSVATGEYLDAIIISIIVLINSIIYYSQRYATHRVLKSLKSHAVSTVVVLRGGQNATISSEELVVGDVLVLSEGEQIPADARVLEANDLQINEAALTGESLPVVKHLAPLQGKKAIYLQHNIVFAGTFVLSGTAKVVVFGAGNNTEYAKVAKLASIEPPKSPVQTKIDSLVSKFVKVVAVVVVGVFGLALLRGIGLSEALRFALSLSVSAVPEGLPIALSVILVLGMRRMAKKNALVQTFRAIEDIGQVTTIATDKTGTLTKNHLQVAETWQAGKVSIEQAAGMSVAHAEALDPLDKTIREAYGPKVSSQNVFYSFSTIERASAIYSMPAKTTYIKGAPEHILSQAGLTGRARSQAESAMRSMTAKGYRVIGFATQKSLLQPKNLTDIMAGKIAFVGFVAFNDEIRAEAQGAITAAKNAGIEIKLITGDHYDTAYNVGKQLGLAHHSSQVIIGQDVAQSKNIEETIANKTIFARVLPKTKFAILQALNRTQITAMTGDGVNDVAALTQADVGIAMGSGSAIAKDASGIVLLDDNFATIIAAVAEGRKIFTNIRKMLFYLFSTTLGEVITMVGALILGLPLPVAAIQLLWINLVTDTTLVLPLGLEPEESSTMAQPPRDKNAPLLSRTLVVRIVLVTCTMAGLTLGIILHMQKSGASLAQLQTTAFLVLIVAQWANALNARSETASIFARKKKPSPVYYLGLGISVALQIILMYTPLANVFDVVAVPPLQLAKYCGVMVVSIVFVVEMHKLYARRAQSSSAAKAVH